MRQSLVVYLMLLSLLLSQAQGIRLEKWFKSVMHHEIHEQKSSLSKTSNGGVGKVILCKEGQCTGKNRKLITATTSTSATTTTTLKNDKNGDNKANPTWKGKSGNREIGGEQENFTANSSPTSEYQEVSHEQYADLMDIGEMDYSPAKRKPPIHN